MVLDERSVSYAKNLSEIAFGNTVFGFLIFRLLQPLRTINSYVCSLRTHIGGLPGWLLLEAIRLWNGSMTIFRIAPWHVPDRGGDVFMAMPHVRRLLAKVRIGLVDRAFASYV
jgi:hypothetical protein